jgi:hypothetical protein
LNLGLITKESASLSADFSVNGQGNQNRQIVGNLSFYETKKDGLAALAARRHEAHPEMFVRNAR